MHAKYVQAQRWLYWMSVSSYGQYTCQYRDLVLEYMAHVATMYVHDKPLTSGVYLPFDHDSLHSITHAR